MNSATKTVLEAELAAAVKAHGALYLASMRVGHGSPEERALRAPLYAAEQAVEAARAKLAPKKAKRGTRTAEVDCNTGRMIITTVR